MAAVTGVAKVNTAGDVELVRRGGASWVAAWLLAVLILAGLLRAGVVDGAVRWGWLLGAAMGVFAAGIAAFVSHAFERAPAVAHRAVAALLAGVWIGCVSTVGWSLAAVIMVGFWAAGLAAMEMVFAPPVYRAATRQQPTMVGPVPQPDGTARELFWVDVLRRAMRQPVPVCGVAPWEKPEDGEQVVAEIPDGLTLNSFELACATIAQRAKLPPGCSVRAFGGAHQGLVVLDVMLRDCLLEKTTAREDITESSINEPFPISRTPRGTYVEVCLREKSMLVGGMPGAGKTTFLHRLIMRFARWSDTVIWVADLNGGGSGWPWVEAWARGDASRPIVDWVADSPEEAAVMVAVAQAIAKDRKVNPEARRRKKEHDTSVLPVDDKLPAIMLVTDEGAEVAQTAGLIGMLVKNGITRTAQIARAEGIRVIMSILRGTSNTLDRDLKAAMAVLTCMRMTLQAEYGHVLDAEPRYKGPMHNGSMFVNLPENGEGPVLTKTENVTPLMIDAHSVATADLRPDLDERAQKVAARITLRDVLGGRDPREHPDIARHPIMRDVEAGRAYSGRWDRAAHKLAELRGEDVPEFADEPQRVQVPERPTVAPPGSLTEQFLLETRVLRREDPTPAAEPAQPSAPAPATVKDDADVLLSPDHWQRDAEPIRPRDMAAAPSSDLMPLSTPGGVQTTVRELILMVLRQAGDEWLTATEIRHRIADEHHVDVTKQRAADVLASLVRVGDVEKDPGENRGPYYRLAVR